MIEAHDLRKVYGTKVAVDGISFSVEPGRVTGFLGPNGAGKSTTMRMIVGLDRPTSGHVTVSGRPYAQLRAPLTEVGALLEAKAIHPGRSARNHLRALAATHGIPDKRVDEVIELTGLSEVARKRVGGFSLGMGQRLGIAAALLGDPQTLLLDEPVNGLDPEGVVWVRTLVKYLASQGRTVFISSHLMAEMALTADQVLVIGRGRILADGPVDEIVARATHATVRVRSPRADELAAALVGPQVTIKPIEPGLLEVTGSSAETVGDLAAARGIPLHELTPFTGSLEDAYMSLTAESVEYHSAGPDELRADFRPSTTPAAPPPPAAPPAGTASNDEEAGR